MCKTVHRSAVLLGLSLSLLGTARVGIAQGIVQNGGDFSSNPAPLKLPTGVILVKGAWASASDSATPDPEGGSMVNNAYTNPYFGLRYSLTPDWTQNYDGPPPSDSGRYVLAQIRPLDAAKQSDRGSIVITAQDLFFALSGSSTARELIQFTNDNLSPDYKVERSPSTIQLAGHSFIRFDYGSDAADLHWYILATQIRCHAVEFVFTSRDTKLLESLIQGMNTINLPGAADVSGGRGGGDVPVCIKNYATADNVLEREDPILTERRFNPIPVRIIIDKEGKVKHIHFLSAFPDQAKTISDALLQWRFRPYVRDGQAMEVETGIMFGRAPRPMKNAAPSQISE